VETGVKFSLLCLQLISESLFWICNKYKHRFSRAWKMLFAVYICAEELCLWLAVKRKVHPQSSCWFWCIANWSSNTNLWSRGRSQLDNIWRKFCFNHAVRDVNWFNCLQAVGRQPRRPARTLLVIYKHLTAVRESYRSVWYFGPHSGLPKPQKARHSHEKV
jgi:hypothetical protein